MWARSCGGLDREAAVDVDRALRPAGRARRVDQHVRRLGVGRPAARSAPRRRRSPRPRRVDRLVPPAVASGVPRRARRRDRRAGGRRSRGGPTASSATASSATAFIGTGEPRRRNPSAVIRTRRLAVAEPGRDRRRAVAGEDRREDRLEPPERQDRDRPSRRASAGRSRRDRPRRTPCGPQHPGGARRRRRAARRSSGAGPRRPRPPRRAPRRPDRAAARGSTDARRVVERRRRSTSRPTGPPSRGRATCVRPALPGDAEVVGGGAPEPAGIGDGARLEGLEIGLAGRPEEAREAGVARGAPGRAPRRVGHVAAEDRVIGGHRREPTPTPRRRTLRP